MTSVFTLDMRDTNLVNVRSSARTVNLSAPDKETKVWITKWTIISEKLMLHAKQSQVVSAN